MSLSSRPIETPKNDAAGLKRALDLGPRAVRAAFDEVGAFLPRKVLAEALGRLLPQQTFSRSRTALFRVAGVRIGEQSLVMGPIRITGVGDPCRYLTIGCFTIITGPLHVDLGAPVQIGDGVRIGHDVTMLTINHVIGGVSLRSGESEFSPIVIGDGTWIASRVVILPGVTVGRGAVVAAGAVVTRDVPPNTLVAGVPARVVRELPVECDSPEIC